MNVATACGAGSRQFTHPLFDRMFGEFGFAEVPENGFDQFRSRSGHTLLFFSEDPVRYRETLDLAVVLPELARAFAGRFAVGVLLPGAARVIAPRYGVRLWPALVLLRDGEYVGAIEGIRDWNDYLGALQSLLAAPCVRPPSIGIAVKADGPGGPCCKSSEQQLLQEQHP
jgi:hydrogenase-1 operon protein HyaE